MPGYSSAWVDHVCDHDRDRDRDRHGAGSGLDSDSCGKLTKTKVKNFITTPLLVKRWLAC